MIGFPQTDGGFFTTSSQEFGLLGAAVRNNTHLPELVITINDVDYGSLFNGIKHNTSIKHVTLYCATNNVVGGAGYDLLKAFQENNSCITNISIYQADMKNGGHHIVVNTLRRCTDLRKIELIDCGITDEQLPSIINVLQSHRSLTELTWNGINSSVTLNVGISRTGVVNFGCHAVATLLRDPTSNLTSLTLQNNNINNEGISILTNSLYNNTKLRELSLTRNPHDQNVVENTFCNLLCNTSSINSTYLSNHTLNGLLLYVDIDSDDEFEEYVEERPIGQNLVLLLRMNKSTNKHLVAIKKILRYHPDMNMEPLFELGAKEEGEQTIKSLPHVIAWFDKVERDLSYPSLGYNVKNQKVSAIYQFVRAIPPLFEGIVTMNVDDKKRKRAYG